MMQFAFVGEVFGSGGYRPGVVDRMIRIRPNYELLLWPVVAHAAHMSHIPIFPMPVVSVQVARQADVSCAWYLPHHPSLDIDSVPHSTMPHS